MDMYKVCIYKGDDLLLSNFYHHCHHHLGVHIRELSWGRGSTRDRVCVSLEPQIKQVEGIKENGIYYHVEEYTYMYVNMYEKQRFILNSFLFPSLFPLYPFTLIIWIIENVYKWGTTKECGGLGENGWRMSRRWIFKEEKLVIFHHSFWVLLCILRVLLFIFFHFFLFENNIPKLIYVSYIQSIAPREIERETGEWWVVSFLFVCVCVSARLNGWRSWAYSRWKSFVQINWNKR